MQKKLCLFLSLCFFSSLAQADSFFCSTQGGRGYVNTGNTMQQVQAACGQPTSTMQQQTPTTQQVNIEQWIYSAGLTTPPNTTGFVNGAAVIRTNAVLPSISFQIVNNKVTAISSSKGGKATQFTCPLSGRSIAIGSTTDQLTNACGPPTTRQVSTQQVTVPSHVITTWSYQVNSYSKPLVMQFQDGVLVQIQSN